MTEVIRFIGRSGSGKTTLLCEVVRLLTEGGLRVGVLKNAHHRVDLDREGKDSFRFARAGAVSVSVASPEKVATFEAVRGRKPSLASMTGRVAADVDVILAEGFHDGVTPYFLLLDPRDSHDGRAHAGELLGIIGPQTDGGSPTFDRNDAAGVARCVADYLASARARTKDDLDTLLEEAAAYHGHLCPGQVLGVRLAVAGCRAVGVERPPTSKKLVVWVETDRCAADAVQTVTGCKLGKRTLKHVDLGKLAATFLNTETGAAVRVSARAGARDRAAAMFDGLRRHEAQLAAYRVLPEAELFDVEEVSVTLGELELPGRPQVRVVCRRCGEEVTDGRHLDGDDGPLCRSCASGAYYTPLRAEAEADARW